MNAAQLTAMIWATSDSHMLFRSGEHTLVLPIDPSGVAAHQWTKEQPLRTVRLVHYDGLEEGPAYKVRLDDGRVLNVKLEVDNRSAHVSWDGTDQTLESRTFPPDGVRFEGVPIDDTKGRRIARVFDTQDGSQRFVITQADEPFDHSVQPSLRLFVGSPGRQLMRTGGWMELQKDAEDVSGTFLTGHGTLYTDIAGLPVWVPNEGAYVTEDGPCQLRELPAAEAVLLRETKDSLSLRVGMELGTGLAQGRP